MGHIPAFDRTYFCIPNVVWASAGCAFRIVSDTLVKLPRSSTVQWGALCMASLVTVSATDTRCSNKRLLQTEWTPQRTGTCRFDWYRNKSGSMRVSLLPARLSVSRLRRSRKMKLWSRRSLFSARERWRSRRRLRNAFVDTRLMFDHARSRDSSVLTPSNARLPTRLKLLPWRSNSKTCNAVASPAVWATRDTACNHRN